MCLGMCQRSHVVQADRATRTGSQLYGTALAQRLIWARQHPQNCSAASFLLYHPHVSGGCLLSSAAKQPESALEWNIIHVTIEILHPNMLIH